MLTISAEIKLLKDGMSKQGFSGMRPSFNTGKELIMCTVFSRKEKHIPLGIPQDVDIELPYGERYEDIIKPVQINGHEQYSQRSMKVSRSEIRL